MYRLLILLLITIILSGQSLAQTKESGSAHIKKLSSESFAGRGYVQQGMKKAASYIRKELKQYGVKDPANNYFMLTPTFQVNTFPNAISFAENINDQTVKSYQAGIDFLLNPSSGDIKLKDLQLNELKDSTALTALKNHTAYYIQKSKLENGLVKQIEKSFIESSSITNSLLIIYDSTKLTWSPSMTKSKNAILYINKPLSSNIINAHWKTELNPSFQGINVIGKVAGQRSDSSVFYTAHYDHLGMLGKHMFPGANDNASGVAMLLDLAKYYTSHQPKYDTYFLFTCGEELGLLGSYFYMKTPITPLDRINLLINLDMVGTGEEGITIVNAQKQTRFFNLMNTYNQGKLKEVKARGEACNSDHCLFDRAGVPAVFIYTLGGKQAYHDVYDNGKDLSLCAYEGLFKLLIEVVKNY